MRPGMKLLVIALLSLLALTTLAPFLWMLLASFKPLQEVEGTRVLPSEWHPGNYKQVFAQVPFARYYVNSVFVAAWVTFLQIFTSAMAAFAFARLYWPSGRPHYRRMKFTRSRRSRAPVSANENVQPESSM